MLFATTVGNILTDDTLTPGAKADDALPKVVPAEPTGEVSDTGVRVICMLCLCTCHFVPKINREGGSSKK